MPFGWLANRSRRFGKQHRRAHCVIGSAGTDVIQSLELRILPTAGIWTQGDADAGRTNFIDVALDPADFLESWNHSASFTDTGTGFGTLVASDGLQVYRTDRSGASFGGDFHVQAFDLFDGHRVWQKDLTTNSFSGVSPPSIAGSTVYVNRPGHSQASGGVSQFPAVIGIDAVTGEFVLERNYESQWGSDERPVIGDDQLVVESGYFGGFAAYSTSTLRQQWFTSKSDYGPPAAAIDDDYVYAFGNGVYRRSDGVRIATQTGQDGFLLSDAMVSQSGRVLYRGGSFGSGVFGSLVVAVDGDSHAEVWTTAIPGTIRDTAVGNGIVAVVADSQLLLLDEATGDVRRTWNAPTSLYHQIVLTRTHAFVESYDYYGVGTATIHAIDLSTAQEVWHYKLPGSATGSWVYGANVASMAMSGGRLLLSTTESLRTFAVSGTDVQARTDRVVVPEDRSVVIAITENDRSISDGPLNVVITAFAEHGHVSMNPDGTVTYVPAAEFVGTDTFVYQITDAEGRNDTATVLITVHPVDDNPVAVAGANQTGEEMTQFLFDGRASFDVDGDLMTYRWDFGDGTFAPTADAQHRFPDQGLYTVTLTVTDPTGRTATDTMLVKVTNTAPLSAAVYGPTTGVRGQPRSYSFYAFDWSAADRAAQFHWSVDWGDGSPVQSVALTGYENVEHTFSSTGTFSVAATATDKDGGRSDRVERRVAIQAIAFDDGSLVVGGTTGSDVIIIRPTRQAGILDVQINGVAQRRFAAASRILIYGQAGNDSIQLRSTGPTQITVPAIIFAGHGNDVVRVEGSSGGNILAGGLGTDVLLGSPGRDLIIGGTGRDTLRGNDGDDILIGAATEFDANLVGLLEVMSIWNRSDLNYESRISRLSLPAYGGQSYLSLFSAAAVHDDRAVDNLFGDGGSDWFFGLLNGRFADVVHQRRRQERFWLLLN